MKKISPFLLTSFTIYSLIVAFFSYTQIYGRFLFAEENKTRQSLNKAVRSAANSIDLDKVILVAEMIDSGMSGEEIEKTSVYKYLTKNMQVQQSIFPQEIGWYYIFRQTEDENKAQFLLTTSPEEGEILDRPGDEYDISKYIDMKIAFSTKSIRTEPERGIGYDYTYNVYLVSSYYPLIHNGQFIGLLGIDCFAESYSKMISEGKIFAMSISIALVLLAIFIPISIFILYTNLIFPAIEKRKDINYIKAKELEKLIKKNRA